MKIMKIILAILIPVAVVCGVLPFVYPLVTPVMEGAELDIGELFKNFFDVFSNFEAFKEQVGFPLFIMLGCFGVGGLLFLLWLVFSIIKRRPIGILFGIIAALVLEVAALGVFINMSYNITIELAGLEKNSLYTVMEYVALGAIVLFIAAFVVHVLIMFKAAKARKEAKKAAKAAKEGKASSGFDPNFEVDYSDLPPCLSEKPAKKEEPAVILRKVDHIQVGPNHVLKGYYVRDDEIDALLASKRFAHEDEIPESILEFLDTKYRAELDGKSLPMFDPNFIPTREEEELLTEDEKFVIEALRKYGKKEPEPEVPDRIRAFLESKPRENLVSELAMFNEGFKPAKRCESDYVDLPFFRQHEEPVEYVEEIIRVEEPEPVVEEEVVDAPKLASKKPVHVSKNAKGKYQLKQVGEDKPFAQFASEEEAVKFAEAIKKVNGVAVRVHDDEGKIRSL